MDLILGNRPDFYSKRVVQLDRDRRVRLMHVVTERGLLFEGVRVWSLDREDIITRPHEPADRLITAEILRQEVTRNVRGLHVTECGTAVIQEGTIGHNEITDRILGHDELVRDPGQLTQIGDWGGSHSFDRNRLITGIVIGDDRPSGRECISRGRGDTDQMEQIAAVGYVELISKGLSFRWKRSIQLDRYIE